MNWQQKLVLVVGILSAVAVGLYPPWVVEISVPEGGRITGYAPLWSLLEPETRSYGVHVDWSRLGLELLLVTLVVSGFILVLERRESHG